jgi:hypothetical protein
MKLHGVQWQHDWLMMNGKRPEESQLVAENKATQNRLDSLCPDHNLNRHLPNSEHKVCTSANMFSAVQAIWQ